MSNVNEELKSALQKGKSEQTSSPAKHQALKEIQKELETKQDQLKEERFLYSIIILCLLDAVLIENVQTIGAMLFLGIPQVILILVLAQRCGVDAIYTWIKNLPNSFSKK